MDHSMLQTINVGDQLTRAGISYMFHNDSRMSFSFNTPGGQKHWVTLQFDKPVWEHDNNTVTLNEKAFASGAAKCLRSLEKNDDITLPNVSEEYVKDRERATRKFRNTANLIETLEERNNLVRDTVDSGRIEIYSSFPGSIMANDSIRSLLETHWDDDYSLNDIRQQMARDNLTDMEKVISEKIEFPESSLIMLDCAEGREESELIFISNDINRTIENLHEISEEESLVEAPGEEFNDSGHMAVYIDKETGDLKIDTEEPIRGNHTYIIRDVKDDFPKTFRDGADLNASEVAELMEHSSPIGEEFAEAFQIEEVLNHGTEALDFKIDLSSFPLSVSGKLDSMERSKPRYAGGDAFEIDKTIKPEETTPDLS